MPSIQILLKGQKNELFEIVKSVGLNPSDFQWREQSYSGAIISRLSYQDNRYFYVFYPRFGGKYVGERCPGAKTTTDSTDVLSWQQLRRDFELWVMKLKEELETPDLWVESEIYQSVFSLPSETQIEEVPFSHEEAERIAVALEQIENRVIEHFDPTPEQIEFIKAKNIYLISRAKRGYPRVDWVNLLMATLMAIATQLAFDMEKAHQLLEFYKEILSPVIGFLG